MKLQYFSHIYFFGEKMLSIWTREKVSGFGKKSCVSAGVRRPWYNLAINPFPNKPWFLRFCIRRLLKTLWEKEKLLVISNFLTINPFPNKHWFLHFCIRRLLKTLWEKEKLLVTSNFSFPHSVF